MKLLEIGHYNSILEFKINFISLLKEGYRDFLIDFESSRLDDSKIISFLQKLKHNVSMQVVNVPFCINNFELKFKENEYGYKNHTLCYRCSYFENCKGNHNVRNIISPIYNERAILYKEGVIHAILEIYLFLMGIGFKPNDIFIGGNKNILYYFLFAGYDMFYNGLSNSFFYISEHNRVYTYIKADKLCEVTFMNKGKNLLFKNQEHLKQYINIMEKNNFDIPLYSSDGIPEYSTEVDYKGMKLHFILNKKFTFDGFFEYNRHQIPNQQLKNPAEENMFVGTRQQSYSGVKKYRVTAINIAKKDYTSLPEEFCLVGVDTVPRYLNEIIQSKCLLLERKTDISHGAIISRELKKDCIYGIDGIVDGINSGDLVEIDFERSVITVYKN